MGLFIGDNRLFRCDKGRFRTVTLFAAQCDPHFPVASAIPPSVTFTRSWKVQAEALRQAS